MQNPNAWGQVYIEGRGAAVPLAFAYPLGTTGTAAIGGMSFRTQLDGQFIIPPGVTVSVQATSAAALLCALCREELKIVN